MISRCFAGMLTPPGDKAFQRLRDRDFRSEARHDHLGLERKPRKY